MNNRIKKMIELRDTVIRLQMELDLILSDLQNIDFDLHCLESVERELIFNIEFLRKQKVVATFSGYRKSLEELKSIREYGVQLTNAKLALNGKLRQKTELFDSKSSDLDIMIEQIRSERVVISLDLERAKRRRKNG